MCDNARSGRQGSGGIECKLLIPGNFLEKWIVNRRHHRCTLKGWCKSIDLQRRHIMIDATSTIRSDGCHSLIRVPRKACPRALGDARLSFHEVADLRKQLIEEMTPSELIYVIRCASLDCLPPALMSRLRYYDRPTLRRLAHLACRACRNRGDGTPPAVMDPFISVSRSWGANH